MPYTDIDLYPDDPKKKIGNTPNFFAGQLATADDFNKWLSMLISQGDYNSDWLDLIAGTTQAAVNLLQQDVQTLNEIAVPGSGTTFQQQINTINSAIALLNTGLTATNAAITALQTSTNTALAGKLDTTGVVATTGIVAAYRNTGGSL